MCNFFSFAWDGGSNFLYSDWDMRKQYIENDLHIAKNPLPTYIHNSDSHTTILTHFGISPKKQENWSAYEYNPFTKKLVVDHCVTGHDVNIARKWVQSLDFKKIVPAIVLHGLKNPLAGKPKEVTEEDIASLRAWRSTWNSLSWSLSAGVPGRIKEAADVTIREREIAWVLSGRLNRDNPVWYGIRESVWAYVSSFFSLDYGCDFSSVLELWNRGFLVENYLDAWSLRSGRYAKVVYELED